MGSKIRPFSRPPSDSPHWDEACEGSDLRREKTEHLLKRIAEAAQVPPSTFYRPSNAVDQGTAAATRSGTTIASDAECEELLAAFKLISDPSDRRRLLEIVQVMAERG